VIDKLEKRQSDHCPMCASQFLYREEDMIFCAFCAFSFISKRITDKEIRTRKQYVADFNS